MAIGSLNLTPEEKLAERFVASLEEKREADLRVSPTGSQRQSNEVKEKFVKRTKERVTKRTQVRLNARTSDQKFESTSVRKKIRHAFDIFADQLISLKELQLARQKATGDNQSLGHLIQEALDLFLVNERTNGRMDE